MYNTKEEERLPEQEPPECHPLESLVRDNVMLALGPPPGLHRVQARHVGDDYYRVNVFVGLDTASCRVAHSYFLKADGSGKILASSPEIARVYPGEKRPPATKQGASPSAN